MDVRYRFCPFPENAKDEKRVEKKARFGYTVGYAGATAGSLVAHGKDKCLYHEKQYRK